ncbi:unnamed protein product [Schistocephalus solidus]|uniref:DUF3668 domain-containing protein n=1 Tax=Schistocephalus solidus TaxID=70667 RepID=A0A183TAZ3_SCHSO|nr:unnamed protein product [Schistocephalus solidus]
MEHRAGNKIVAKLVTVYDSLSDSPDALRRLVRARWHPTAKGVLLLLTKDGFLHLLRCSGSVSSSLSVKMELKVSVLGTLEAGHRLSTDKENIQDSQKKGKTKLNLNFALGAVCSDFDIGSPLFTAEAKSFSGDILMVSPSPNTFSEALVRVVRILPSAEDCYTFDFDSVLVQRSTDAGNSPDVLCIANRSGRIFHGIVLHVPAAVLLESDSTSHVSRVVLSALKRVAVPLAVGPGFVQRGRMIEVDIGLHLRQSFDGGVGDSEGAIEEAFEVLGQSLHNLRLLNDKAMVRPSVGTWDRLFHQQVPLVSLPDEEIVQQLPVPRPKSSAIEKYLCFFLQGRSVPVLYLIDGVDLQLAKPLSSQKSQKDAPVISSSGSLSSDGPPQLSKISLLPSALNMLDANMAHYLCVHQFGIHCIILPWIERLGQLCSKASDDINFHSMGKFLSPLFNAKIRKGCTAEHLLLTHLDSKNADEAPLPGSLRSVIGVIPPQTLISDTSASRDDTFGGCQYIEETEVNSLLVLFSSRPHVVKIVLPQCLSLNPQPHSLPQLSLPSGDLPDVSLPETPLSTSVSLSCRVTESDFFRSCRRVLSNSSVRLPVLSTDLREDVFSEAEFIRFFVKTISSLRSSRLGRLSTLCASVYQFAEHAEGQLAAQYEAISYLAQERNQLQRKAVSLTERHSRILERQEALNHRLSELARRIYSVEAGLTNAEVQMRLEVQNLRDRLKSGLLGWFESMQLQYNHLTNVVEKAQATANSGRFGRLVAGVGLMGSAAPISLRRSTISADLTDAQVKSITAALKEEGSELDSLIKAVERLNTLTVALP